MHTTSHELLDIVDLHDRVIGSATRGEIHQQGLWHRAVHVMVFDDAGSVLLQKRSMQKDQCAGMWDTACAGHVESGDIYENTAPRELQEELGFTPTDSLQALFKMSPDAASGWEFAMVYSLVYTGSMVPAADEIDELRWFSFAEMDRWARVCTQDKSVVQDLTSGFIKIWQRYRSQAIAYEESSVK